MKLKRYSKYLLIILFLIVTYFAILVLKPFIVPVIASMILVYVFYPLYRLVLKLIKNKGISAFIMSFLVILLTGLMDHYWLTLQQTQLIFAIVIGASMFKLNDDKNIF